MRELELVGEVMAEWSVQETRSLLGIWGDADVQSKLDGVVRNRTIYERIARELVGRGNSAGQRLKKPGEAVQKGKGCFAISVYFFMINNYYYFGR